MQEAQLAKSKMNRGLFFGRPIIVRMASEKTTAEGMYNGGPHPWIQNSPAFLVESWPTWIKMPRLLL
jgi:hypothetical protein